ncbi:MAG: hypothetical protein K2Q33_05630, partial [Gammaproteobacteria bacterium]|nr:hypothetical protein [Gammaproteobacteria bacterium]
MTISKFINNVLIFLTIIAFVAQFFIDFSTVNIATSCIILASSISTLLYFRWTKALDSHPLSSFALFGFCITSLLGALWAQSSSWVPVSNDLYQPLTTFSMLAMYQVVAILAHALYRVISSSSSETPGLLRHTFQVCGVYAIPSVQVLWVMGGMGTFFLILSKYSAVANGFSFLAWSPFLIPIYIQQVGEQYCNPKRNYIFLVGFAVLIAMIAMAFNARGMMLIGGTTVGLLFLLVAMRSKALVTSTMLLRFGMFILISAALSWPASNLVTAMALTRADRGKISGSEMLAKTIENFQSPEKLEQYTKFQLAEKLRSAYDENYIANPMMARLIITKFHDNSIYFADKVSDKGSEEMMRTTGDFLWATLPQPFLDAIKVNVNKDKMFFSMGDMLANFAIGTPLSGLRTGSIFGQGWVLFGYYFPLIYFAMCFILFAALDLFSTRTA